MNYVGLGQTSLTPCNWLQQYIFGGYYVETPGSLANTWVTCAQAAANVGTLPANSGPGGSPTLPSQNSISQLSTNPTPPDGYTAVAMGTDSSGDQLYAYMPTAQTQQLINSQSIAQQLANLDTGSANDTGTDCSWFDTPGVINNLFNPTCGIPWGLIGVLILGAIGMISGLRK